MSDWDFLYEMNELGYSPEEIADAAGSGLAPWEWEYISKEWIEPAPAQWAQDAFDDRGERPRGTRLRSARWLAG